MKDGACGERMGETFVRADDAVSIAVVAAMNR